MPPHSIETSPAVMLSDDGLHPDGTIQPVVTEDNNAQKQPAMQIVWRNVALFAFLHLASLYGMFLVSSAHPLTWLWTVALIVMSGLGITAGAHRLWAHRSYTARLPLRILLAAFNSLAFQNDIIEWSRDHRSHHKFSETDADPHNAKRGFFFSHVGWLLVRKHPDVKEQGQKIDLSDLYRDPVLIMQRKFYLPSVVLMSFILPCVVPWYMWGESLWNGYFICSLLRYCLILNFTWLVNSAAHMWGNRPYDINISPTENLLVTLGAIGEGFHNYHHTFPQDYAASEFGWKLNISTMFIDFMASIGQVTSRKCMSRKLVEKRKLRTGDGTSWFGTKTLVMCIMIFIMFNLLVQFRFLLRNIF